MSSPPDQSAIRRTLAPCFLIASPTLRDPHFAQAVVLLADHTPEGALGFIINRPAPINLAQIVSQLRGEDDPDDGDTPDALELPQGEVFWGGPVQRSSAWILYERRGDAPLEEGSTEVADGLVLSTDDETMEDFVNGLREEAFCLLLGYAGWGPMQIEAETSQGAWLPLDASAELVFNTPVEARWETAIRRLGLIPGGFIMGGPGGMA